jgi:uncharacterized protein (DUF433 family)
MKVSYFSSILSTSPKVSKDVSYFLERIRTGESKDLISELRTTTDQEKQQELKKQLPVVCFNGFFANRSKSGLKKASGLLTLDFDEVKGIEEANNLKEELKKDKHIFACWLSPRLGVKALYRIIEVENDKRFKQVFEQIKEKYPDLDDSGKDISRACFESVDSEIYINLEADVFVPDVVILPHEEEDISEVTNVPLIDGDEISNRLIKWFQSKYDSSQRNNSIFKLSAAFNDFGVDKFKAVTYCMRYAEKGFSTNEIQKIIDSAYKKTSQFGTKFFEDKIKAKKISNMVLAGKSKKEVTQEFPEIKKEQIENEIKIAKEAIDLSVFWFFNDKQQVQIEPYKFKLYLQNKQCFKYYPVTNEKAFIFIRKDDNFIEEVNEYQIKDVVINDLLYRDEIDVFNTVAMRTTLFQPNFLSMLETANVEIEKDGKDFAWLYYKNSAVKVYKDRVEPIKYEDLEKHIWKDRVIDRSFIKADHHDSMFRSFVWFISGEDTNRYNTMKSVIGYLLHSYKTSANNRAVILNDEVISENPNGRSGKGLIIQSLGKMKKSDVIDGKNFDFGKSFAFQTVSTDCQVLAFDDVKKNFNFELLFSAITEGLTIEYKGMPAVKIPVQDSPKIIISTNYTIKAEGGSFEGRMFEVELSSYFNSNFSPLDKFGCMLFDGWDHNEWARFDQFMINCLQYYLENGLVAYEHKNLKYRKLINNTAREFVYWMDEKNFEDKQRIDYKLWIQHFMNENEDFKKWLTERKFNQWIKSYIEFKGMEVKSIVVNGKRMYEVINPNKNTEENLNEDRDIWDDVMDENGF